MNKINTTNITYKNIRKNTNNIVCTKKEILHSGFTLIEVLIVIGILAILATVVLVAVNPSRQFKLARDSQRTANVTAILNAIGQDMTDNRGIFSCGGQAQSLPTTSTIVKSTGSANLAPCLVPTYIASLPFDPSAVGAHYISITDYNTEYAVSTDVDGRVTVKAEGELSTSSISVTR